MAIAAHFDERLRVSPALEKLLLAFVWLTFVTNAIIVSEPAPADLFMMGFVVVIPLFGLVRFTSVHATLFAGWMIIVATGLLVAGGNEDFKDSAKHMLITLYLAVFCVVLAGFVTRNPTRYLPVIWRGYIIGALIAAVAGIIGYYDLIPGSYEMFTRYWRARGTFKDANVFAPFLVPALLICLHSIIVNRVKHSLVSILLVLTFFTAILLSFSRGG